MSDALATTLSLALTTACEIASGVREPDPAATALRMRAAKRDLNARGKGTEWHRMVYRGSWTYYADGRMPSGRLLAADRRVTLYGDVYEGEILCSHDRGGPVDAIYLVVDEPNEHGKRGRLHDLEWSRQRNGLRAILPTGAHVTLPDPRTR